MDEAVARKIWLEAVEKVKDQTLHPSLWRALEASYGVTMEDDTFVIGFRAADYPHAGLIRSSEHKGVIERTLARMLGKPQVRIKTIEGITLADYENVKRQEALSEAQRQAALEKKAVERASIRSWDSVLETVSRMYARTNLRQLPHIRARYLREALVVISEAMDENYGDNPDEVAERALARVIDKVATLIEAPSVVVAAELWRLRNGRVSGSE